MNTRKILHHVCVILVLLTVTTASWAGGSSESSKSGVQELTLARFFGDAGDVGSDIEAAVGEAAIIQSIINAFDENNTDIQVNDLVVGWGEYYDQLKANFASQSAPDVFVLHASRILEFIDVGALADLTDDLASVGIDVDDWVDGVRDTVTYDGKIYAVPMDVHAGLWHVNVDLMQQAGLVDASGVPLQPTSAAELLTHAKQFKEATGKNYLAADFSQDTLGVWVVMALMWQQGANIFQGNKVNINSPEAKRAVEAIVSLFDAGYADPTLNYTDAQQQFLEGEIGVLINGTWVVDFYAAQAQDSAVPLTNYTVQSFPTLFNTGATWGDSHIWSIPATLKANKTKYDNALKMLAWIYENNFHWSRTGHLAIRKSVLSSSKYNALAYRDEYRNTVNIINNITPTTKSGAIQDAIKRELFAVWLTGKSIDDALEDAETAIDDIMN